MTRKTVAVDLDAVLARSDGRPCALEVIGEPLPGAADFTRTLATHFDVLVFTSRVRHNPDGRIAPGYGPGDDRRPLAEQVALVKAWLDDHGFAYHAVWAGAGKPKVWRVIDDRGVNCRPQDFGASEYDAALRACLEIL